MNSMYNVTCCHGWRWGFWFRIRGYGLHVSLAKGHQPLFSERYGYTKAWYVAGLRIATLLRPREMANIEEPTNDGY